jgi:hypothetical protein
MDLSALLDLLNLNVVVHGGNVDCCVIHLHRLLLGRKDIDLVLERSIDDPVHSLARVVHEETDSSSDDATWEEGEPNNLVGMSLGFVKCSKAGTEDLSVDAGDLVEALAREVEADELADVLGVESKRKNSTNCANDVSIDRVLERCLCNLLIASGI